MAGPDDIDSTRRLGRRAHAVGIVDHRGAGGTDRTAAAMFATDHGPPGADGSS